MTAASSSTPPASKWTARDILFALFNHQIKQGWAPLTEITAVPGGSWSWTERAALYEAGASLEQMKPRRIDLLCVRKSRSKKIAGIELLAIEVKVSRSDFLSDVRNPDKQALWRELADRHAYAVPEGMVTVAELPEGSGLLNVARSGAYGMVSWGKQAPRNTDRGPVPDALVDLIATRAAWAEARVKGLTYDTRELVDDPEALRSEITALRTQLARAERQTEKAIEKAEHWQQGLAAAVGVPCATCGALLTYGKPSRNRPHFGEQWQHGPADEQACYATRRAAAEAETRAMWEGRDSARGVEHYLTRLYVPGPLPVPLFQEDETP